MSSCQGGSDAVGHLANWLNDVNPEIKTKGWVEQAGDDSNWI